MSISPDRERKERLLRAMAQAGLDAIAVSSASEVLLLSGYWPIFSSSIAVYTAAGECHVIVPEDEQELAEKTGHAHWIAYQPGSEDRLTDLVHELRQPLGHLLSKLGLTGHARVGVRLELSEQPAPYAVLTAFRQSFHRLLGELLPQAALVSCDALLEQQKSIRTPHEMDKMRQARAVARDGYAVAAEAVQPGLREAEVASIFQAAFDRSPAAEVLERSYGFFFCMSGPNSATAAAAYARTRQRRLAPGDLVMIHANTCADGFWTDITRTYTVGPPPARHQEMRSAVAAAREAALACIHPGVPASDVDAAARGVMTERGFGKAFKHATGHGVGYAAASGNALPRIHAGSPDILEAGMTFNVEPAAYFKGYGGMRHCDVVAVTAAGCDVLSDF